jgi:hypothetical protein
MITFESGVLDKTRLFSNLLMIILVAGNIFFSIQYTESIRQQNMQQTGNTNIRVQASKFLKLFVNVVLNTDGKAISYDDRVALENDARQMKDSEINAAWDAFVASSNSKIAQENAVKLMKMLTNKLLLN